MRQYRGHFSDMRQVLQFQLALLRRYQHPHTPSRDDRENNKQKTSGCDNPQMMPGMLYKEVRGIRGEVDASQAQALRTMKWHIGAEGRLSLNLRRLGSKQLATEP